MRLGSICWVALLLALLPVSLQAQETLTFKDWAVNCAKTADGATACAMNQQFVRDDDKKTAGLLVISYPPRSAVPLMKVITPLGVNLQRGLAIKVDEADQHQLPYSTCLPSGCESVVGIGEPLLKSMQAGASLRIAYVHLARGKQVIPFSLLGFSAAYSHLVQIRGG